MTEKKKEENKTKSNLIAILLYALAIAAALGFNEFVSALLKKYQIKGEDDVMSKGIYAVLMILAALTLAYFTKSSVPV